MKSPFIQKSGFSPRKLKRRKKKSLSIGKSLESGKEVTNTNVEPSLGAKENSINNTTPKYVTYKTRKSCLKSNHNPLSPRF